MKKIWIILALMSLLAGAASPASVTRQQVNTDPPAEPVKLIFIHHSTGGNWLADADQNELGGGLGRALMENNYYVSATNYGWGPDSIGDATDIPNWLDWFTSENSPRYLEALFAEDGQNFGDFGSWPRLAQEPDGLNRIVVFKSCFPNSELEGSPNDDPSAEGWLSVGHAKYVYNQILTYFATRPDVLFVVVTAPPLTSSSNAANARAFNNWLVEDWLAENNYTLHNVAVFDFYNVLTGPENHHQVVDGQIVHTYKNGQNLENYPSGDDHPSQAGNTKATAEFVPMLNAFYNAWVASGESTNVAVPAEPASSEETQVQSTEAAEEAPAETSAADGSGDAFSADFEGDTSDWEGFYDIMTDTSLDCSATANKAYSGGNALQMAFKVAQNGWATCGVSFSYQQDWSAYPGVSFMAQADAADAVIHVELYAGSLENRQTYYYALSGLSASEWQAVAIPWLEFKRVEWEENGGQAFTLTDQVLGIAFGVPSQGKGTLWVDDLRLTGSANSAIPASQETSTETKKGWNLCGGAAALPIAAVGVTLWSKKKKTKN